MGDGDRAWAAALADPAGCTAEIGTLQLITRRPKGYQPGRVLDVHLCNLIVGGCAGIRFGGREHRCAPGTLVWLPPGVPHDWAVPLACSTVTWLNCRFRLRHGQREVAFTEPILRPDAAGCRRWFEAWLDDRLARHPDAPRRFVHILALLWSDLQRPAFPTGGLDRQRRLALMQHVHRCAGARPSSAALARVVGLSEDHFRRAFRRSFGMSPRAWVLRERLALAADRLRLDPESAVAAIAAELGWDDPGLFSRQFRARYGSPPDRWRRG